MRYLFLPIAACLLVAAHAQADTIRVTTWKFPDPDVTRNATVVGNDAAPLKAAAKVLETLNPDLICLQGVPDWEACQKLCDLLGSQNYRVLTCSGFAADRSRPGENRQVAIIARQRAILAWTEQVNSAGGFAFAVTELGGQKVGVFSLQATGAWETGTNDLLVARLLAQVKSCDAFRTNRPAAFLVLGTPALLSWRPIEPRLGLAGFASVHAGIEPASFDKGRPLPEILVRHGSFVTLPRATTVFPAAASMITCDVNLETPSSAATLAARTALLLPGESPVVAAASPPDASTTAGSHFSGFSLSWLIAAALGGIVLFWSLGRLFGPPRSTALQVIPAGTVLPLTGAGNAADQRVVLSIVTWLKTRFMQRLLAQRQAMIDAQNLTAQRTLVIEEKLERMETSLQERISGYETRIQRLESELSAATAENRDLIRDQISLLKKQLAVAKAGDPFRRN